MTIIDPSRVAAGRSERWSDHGLILNVLGPSAQETIPRDVTAAITTDWWASRSLWLLLALLSLLPFLLSPLPPQADLFSHIGRYHVMVFGEQSEFLRRYYSFNWTLIGNLGQDLLVYPLVPVLGAERAAFLLTALIPPATILGIRQLSLAAHGEVQPSALAAVPFVYSFPFLFGFVNYCTGIALALWTVAAWYRWRELHWAKRSGVFLAASSLIWVVHMAAWAVLVVAIGAIELASAIRSLGWRQIGRVVVTVFLRAFPLIVVPVALTLFWRDGLDGGTSYEFPALWLKFYWIAFILRDQSMILDLASVVLIGGIGLLLLVLRNRLDPGLGLAAGLLLILFFLIPGSVLTSYFADLRLLPPFAIFALTAFQANRLTHHQKSALAAVAVALFTVRLGATTMGWMERGAALTADLEALNHVERGARIAALAPTRMFESWDNSGMSHLPSLAMVRREAFVNTQWDIDGAQLMQPRYNAGRDFNSDKSAKMRMKSKGEGRSVENMIATLPRERFDYVWLFKTDIPDDRKHGFQLKFRNAESVLYAIDHRVTQQR